MDELIPVLIAFALGSLVWRISNHVLRNALGVSAVLFAAFLATVITGEFSRSHLYLLIDLAEATAGFTAAVALSGLLARRSAPSDTAKSS